ncbi:MAG: tetratricopeptide repeat protein [Blautia sp.]|nr:tetratricopeptide repeat protein [Blautia sp.]
MELSEAGLQAKDLNQQGVVLLQVGNVEAAKEKFDQAIDTDPMVMDSYRNLGDLYAKTGEYQNAKNYYKKALLIEKDGSVYFQYGNVCFMNDEPHEGLEYYNLALSAGFDNDEMFFFMGLAYEHMNDDRMALRYVQKAITKNPSRPDYKVKKVSILLRLDMVEEAKKSIDELLLNDPELYDGYHMKTALLLNGKDFAQAVEFSKQASERFPEDADLLFDYANAVAQSGKYEEALVIVRNAGKMKHFEDARAKFLLLETQINAELGNMDAAIEKCGECISMEEEGEFYAEARFVMVNLAMTRSDFESALEQAAQIVENNVHDSYYYAALYYKPFCLSKLGRQEEAGHFYKEAVSLYRMATLRNPEALDAYLYRAMCLKDMAQYDDALELLEFMENLGDQIAETHTIRAEIYKLTGRETLMKEELEKAYKIRPELKEAFKERGE